MERFDTVIILAHGGVTPEGGADAETLQRIHAGVDLVESGRTDNIVVTGYKSFLDHRNDIPPLARIMKTLVEQRGIPSENIFAETYSLDTIGNAVYTKQDFVIPEEWEKLAVVTSPSHTERTKRIFSHVMGNEICVKTFAAAEAERKGQKVYELLGAVLEHVIIDGTKPGDDEHVEARLERLIPGYIHQPKSKIVGNYARRFVGLDKA